LATGAVPSGSAAVGSAASTTPGTSQSTSRTQGKFAPGPAKSLAVKSTVHLSGLHCIFEVGHPHSHQELPTLAVLDKSKHGVYLNGERLDKELPPQVLIEGDIVSLGGCSPEHYALRVETWAPRLKMQWLKAEEEAAARALLREIGLELVEPGGEREALAEVPCSCVGLPGPVCLTSGVILGYEAIVPMLCQQTWILPEWVEHLAARVERNTTENDIPDPRHFEPDFLPGEPRYDPWAITEERLASLLAQESKIPENGEAVEGWVSIAPRDRSRGMRGLVVICLQRGVMEEVEPIVKRLGAQCVLTSDLEEDYETVLALNASNAETTETGAPPRCVVVVDLSLPNDAEHEEADLFDHPDSRISGGNAAPEALGGTGSDARVIEVSLFDGDDGVSQSVKLGSSPKGGATEGLQDGKQGSSAGSSGSWVEVAEIGPRLTQLERFGVCPIPRAAITEACLLGAPFEPGRGVFGHVTPLQDLTTVDTWYANPNPTAL